MGNVYMEAEEIRYKNATYPNVARALDKALEGGGGGSTTVVANPEGSATADLSKLQVGDTIYEIPAEAGDISYDNTLSGMTADDVQEAIDELNTSIGGISELIPLDATTSNKLATAGDIPGTATTLAAGIVQPDGTTITIVDGVISAAGGSGAGETYSTTEALIGSWLGDSLYRKCYNITAMPSNSELQIPHGLSNVSIKRVYGVFGDGSYSMTMPYASPTPQYNAGIWASGGNIIVKTATAEYASYSGVAILEYTKNS